MIDREGMVDEAERYEKDITIATIGSHSALQILKGAKDEGFKTLVACKRGRENIYDRFRLGDEKIVFDEYGDLLRGELQEKMREKNSIVVPHGSFVAYIGVDGIENEFRVPILGNRKILRWESDRDMEREWLEKSGIKVPKKFSKSEEIDKLSIVKFPGARGGKGYFLARSRKEFKKKTKKMIEKDYINEEDVKNATIQEFVAGVNMYLSYFYSPLKEEVEFFGVDRRYETNIDGIARIPSKEQGKIDLEPSYVVVGNMPIVVRESLLDRILEMGDRLVEKSKEIAPPGMNGPFCLETIVDEDLKFTGFEISARIVAGTNPFINGSPYSYVLHGKGMSMGRRIAVEVKNAIKIGKISTLVS